MIRTASGGSLRRFPELAGVSRRICHARPARLRAGDRPEGPWPVPVIDRVDSAGGHAASSGVASARDCRRPMARREPAGA